MFNIGCYQGNIIYDVFCPKGSHRSARKMTVCRADLKSQEHIPPRIWPRKSCTHGIVAFLFSVRAFSMSRVFYIFLPWPPVIPGNCFIPASWYSDLFLLKLSPACFPLTFFLNDIVLFFVMNLKAPLKSFLELGPL